VVLERRRHVRVPGQRVEVLFLVVVDGRFVTHPLIDLIRVVEIILRNRVEHQFGLGHGLLLRGGLVAGSVTRDALTVTLTVSLSRYAEIG
jgi:hypothetical protein